MDALTTPHQTPPYLTEGEHPVETLGSGDWANANTLIMKLKVVWISAKQKDGYYSALALHEEVIFGGLINQSKGFTRRSNSFKLGEVITVPDEYTAKVIGKDWVFTKN